MTTKLTPIQQQLIAKIREHGSLVRFRGGFWSGPETPVVKSYDMDVPEWYFPTRTVQALIGQGVLTVTQERFRYQKWGGEVFVQHWPNAVKLTETLPTPGSSGSRPRS